MNRTQIASTPTPAFVGQAIVLGFTEWTIVTILSVEDDRALVVIEAGPRRVRR